MKRTNKIWTADEEKQTFSIIFDTSKIIYEAIGRCSAAVKRIIDVLVELNTGKRTADNSASPIIEGKRTKDALLEIISNISTLSEEGAYETLGEAISRLRLSKHVEVEVMDVVAGFVEQIRELERSALSAAEKSGMARNAFIQAWEGNEANLKLVDAHEPLGKAADEIRNVQKKIGIVESDAGLSAAELKSIHKAIRAADRKRDAARAVVVENSTNVVHMCAKGFDHLPVPHAELFQAGMEGLVIALDDFKPGYLNRFVTFAIPQVKKRMKAGALDWMQVVELPEREISKRAMIYNAEKELAQMLGHTPSSEQIAEVLGVTVDFVATRRGVGTGVALSMDVEVGEEDDADATLHAVINNECSEEEDRQRQLMSDLSDEIPKNEDRIERMITFATTLSPARRLALLEAAGANKGLVDPSKNIALDYHVGALFRSMRPGSPKHFEITDYRNISSGREISFKATNCLVSEDATRAAIRHNFGNAVRLTHWDSSTLTGTFLAPSGFEPGSLGFSLK